MIENMLLGKFYGMGYLDKVFGITDLVALKEVLRSYLEDRLC